MGVLPVLCWMGSTGSRAPVRRRGDGLLAVLPPGADGLVGNLGEPEPATWITVGADNVAWPNDPEASILGEVSGDCAASVA